MGQMSEVQKINERWARDKKRREIVCERKRKFGQPFEECKPFTGCIGMYTDCPVFFSSVDDFIAELGARQRNLSNIFLFDRRFCSTFGCDRCKKEVTPDPCKNCPMYHYWVTQRSDGCLMKFYPALPFEEKSTALKEVRTMSKVRIDLETRKKIHKMIKEDGVKDADKIATGCKVSVKDAKRYLRRLSGNRVSKPRQK